MTSAELRALLDPRRTNGPAPDGFSVASLLTIIAEDLGRALTALREVEALARVTRLAVGTALGDLDRVRRLAIPRRGRPAGARRPR